MSGATYYCAIFHQTLYSAPLQQMTLLKEQRFQAERLRRNPGKGEVHLK